MTRDEFISADRQRQGLVVSITVYSYFGFALAVAAAVVFLCALPFTSFLPDDRAILRVRVFWILGLCLLMLGGIHFVYHRVLRPRFVKLGLFCSSCHKLLDSGVAETGECTHCGERVFDQ